MPCLMVTMEQERPGLLQRTFTTALLSNSLKVGVDAHPREGPEETFSNLGTLRLILMQSEVKSGPFLEPCFPLMNKVLLFPRQLLYANILNCNWV